MQLLRDLVDAPQRPVPQIGVEAESVPTALWDGDYWQNFQEVEEARRQSCPVRRERLPDGAMAWIVYGHGPAREALRHPDLRRDADEIQRIMRRYLGPDAPLSGMFTKSAMLSDGTDRERLLTPLKAHFTPRLLKRLEPRVESITADILDGLDTGADVVDLMQAVAFPLPIAVLAELLGLPEAERPQLRWWTSALMGRDPDAVGRAGAELTAYFQRLVSARRRNPGDDVVSALVRAHDGGTLDDDEVLGTLFLLLVAGHETTMNLIGNGAHALLSAGMWAELAEDPSSMDQVVNELLRLDSPVRFTPHRYSATDVTIAGITIPADEIVLVALGSANRDPDKFGENAGTLDIRRADAAAHVAFGHGPRYCLGAPLARVEGAVALRELTRRWPLAELATDRPHLREHAVLMSGWQSLRVRLRP
ncbi:cytochrome P450 [Streptomyces zhihengii]|uniref:cytochrome P450 n=1 Tax=Streptomyces zhihengii TaxID=1818004 RepID=UPI0033B9EB72